MSGTRPRAFGIMLVILTNTSCNTSCHVRWEKFKEFLEISIKSKTKTSFLMECAAYPKKVEQSMSS